MPFTSSILIPLMKDSVDNLNGSDGDISVFNFLVCVFFFSHVVDGGWAAWKSWSTCSATCGGGLHDRSRACNNPPPQHGGTECQGDNKEIRSCNERPCPG